MHLSISSENELTDKNMKILEKATKEDTIWVNKSNYCGHCHTFQPEWVKLKEKMKNRKINMIDVEASAMEKIKSRSSLYKKVTGKDQSLYFPMIIIFTKVGDKTRKKLYEGNRTSADLEDQLSKIKTKPSVKPSVKPSIKPSVKPSIKPKPKTKVPKKGGTNSVASMEKEVKKIIENFFK